MGKKLKKEDLKKTQRALAIWLTVISILVMAIVIGIAMSNQKSKDAANPKNKAVVENSQTDSSDSNKQNNVVENSKTASDSIKQKTEDKSMTQNNNITAPTELSKAGTTKVQIATSKGNIDVVVQNEKMPITVTNFLKLVMNKFYDGLTFHRVEDWVIQGGDPNGNGTGGSKDKIKLETNPDLKNVRGAIAMARSSDPNSATSQFYILKKDASWLDGDYAVFGNVVSGMDVVDKMAIGDKILSIKIVQ